MLHLETIEPRTFALLEKLLSLRALTYFEDAEESEDPVSLKSQTWQDVKRFIRQQVNEFLK